MQATKAPKYIIRAIQDARREQTNQDLEEMRAASRPLPVELFGRGAIRAARRWWWIATNRPSLP